MTVEQWLERAEYDLETAKAMLKAGRYLYVLFCCQQAVEKIQKALFVDRGENPPFLHNLIRLADLLRLDLSEERYDLLHALSGFYIKTRYENDIARLSAAATAKYSKQLYSDSLEVCKWLKSLLKLAVE